MPLDYSDKRGRYKGLHPSSMPPGTPRFDNPSKRTDVVYSRPAIRGQREAFRQTTAPKPPEPAPEPIAPPVEPTPTAASISLPDTTGTPCSHADKEL